MMKGLKPREIVNQQDKNVEEKKSEKAVKGPRLIMIPDNLFENFKDGINSEQQEEAFLSTAFYVVITFLENLFTNDKWAI